MAFAESWKEYEFIINANDIGMIGKARVLSTNQFVFFHGSTNPAGRGLSIFQVLLSHSNTLHSVEFLWTNDRPDAEAST
jgi:hypothetical protein